MKKKDLKNYIIVNQINKKDYNKKEWHKLLVKVEKEYKS